MEVLILLLLVVILILLFNIKWRQKEIEDRTHKSFLSLKKELLELKEAALKKTVPEAPVRATDDTVIQWRPQLPAETNPPLAPAPVVTPKEANSDEAVPAEPAAMSPETAPTITPTPAPNLPPPPVAAESWWDKWLQNNPDLEKFIGENLINKIGITVLVLGIAFFVKYAIDQNWIAEAGRVSIGVGCGIALVALAHYLRNSYRSFSSVLAGGGIAVFYFTIAFAFHEYQLFSQTAAFIIMIIITVFAVALSLLYDKLELAVIAAIGGFITPFLVSTGSGNYIVLFSYLLILNIGMLVLAYFKKWQAINVIALFFTIAIYGGWLGRQILTEDGLPMYANALLFATVFYLLFLLMSMVYNIRTQRPFKAFDFSLLMLTTFSYYAAGITCLHYWNAGAYQGLFTVALGITNFCLAWYFYRTGKGDKNLLYLLIGLTLTFISLAAPVQLHGHTITLFWSLEFVLLYWLHQRSGIRVFKIASLVILMLSLTSLLLDWEKANLPAGNHLLVIYKNLQGLVTNVVSILAFTVYALLLRKEAPATLYLATIRNSTMSVLMILVAAVLLYLTCLFGVNLYFYESQFLDVPNGWHQLVTYVFVALLIWINHRQGLNIKPALQLAMVGACILFYFISIPYATALRAGAMQGKYPVAQWWLHWITALTLLYVIYQAILLHRRETVPVSKLFTVVISLVLVAYFSVEGMHAYTSATAGIQQPGDSLQQYSKAGTTIVWAICSFALMWTGMKYKFKTLRIISLCLFSLALIKLFLFDIRNISEGGKIAAFIMLGILLLIISFMYQKLKKIIIDDASR